MSWSYAIGEVFRAVGNPRDVTLKIKNHAHSNVLSRVEARFLIRSKIHVYLSHSILDGKLSSLNFSGTGANIFEIVVKDGFESLENN
jgi:hypothetical protein